MARRIEPMNHLPLELRTRESIIYTDMLEFSFKFPEGSSEMRTLDWCVGILQIPHVTGARPCIPINGYRITVKTDTLESVFHKLRTLNRLFLSR